MSDKSAVKWLRFVGIAVQMGAMIWLGSILGAYLDKRMLRTDELFYKGVTMGAVFLATGLVIKEVIKIGKSE